MTATKDLSGQTIVITGGSSGIGAAAAAAFARANATVVLAARDLDKGRRVATTLGPHVTARRLDLASLESVRAFAATVDQPVDVLVNNAGAMSATRSLTVDGFESQLGVNHLGHFALTNLLLPSLRRRVVTITSTFYRNATIDFADLQWEARAYSPFGAYARSKLANLLFTVELQRRLTRVGSPVIATAAHPGWASTGFTITSGNRLLDVASRWSTRLLAQGPEGGALPTVFAATEDVAGGSLVGPSRLGGVRGPAKVADIADNALDEEVAARLWAVSEELTGVGFPLHV